MAFWSRAISAAVVVPNRKPASDTIRNSSIGSRETFAEITVQVPLTADLAASLDGEATDVLRGLGRRA
jgi:hypothetical protein